MILRPYMSENLLNSSVTKAAASEGIEMRPGIQGHAIQIGSHPRSGDAQRLDKEIHREIYGKDRNQAEE